MKLVVTGAAREGESINEHIREAERTMIKNYFNKKEKRTPPRKKIVEPLVDVGLMPRHYFFEAVNREIESSP